MTMIAKPSEGPIIYVPKDYQPREGSGIWTPPKPELPLVAPNRAARRRLAKAMRKQKTIGQT